MEWINEKIEQMKLRKVNRIEKKDYPNAVVTITIGGHEAQLTQKDVDLLYDKLNEFVTHSVRGSVFFNKEIETHIWEEIELPLCEADKILKTDNYKRYLEAVKWAKFGRDERTDR